MSHSAPKDPRKRPISQILIESISKACSPEDSSLETKLNQAHLYKSDDTSAEDDSASESTEGAEETKAGDDGQQNLYRNLIGADVHLQIKDDSDHHILLSPSARSRLSPQEVQDFSTVASPRKIQSPSHSETLTSATQAETKIRNLFGEALLNHLSDCFNQDFLNRIPLAIMPVQLFQSWKITPKWSCTIVAIQTDETDISTRKLSELHITCTFEKTRLDDDGSKIGHAVPLEETIQVQLVYDSAAPFKWHFKGAESITIPDEQTDLARFIRASHEWASSCQDGNTLRHERANDPARIIGVECVEIPKSASAFAHYSRQEFLEYVKSTLLEAKRIDDLEERAVREDLARLYRSLPEVERGTKFGSPAVSRFKMTSPTGKSVHVTSTEDEIRRLLEIADVTPADTAGPTTPSTPRGKTSSARPATTPSASGAKTPARHAIPTPLQRNRSDSSSTEGSTDQSVEAKLPLSSRKAFHKFEAGKYISCNTVYQLSPLARPNIVISEIQPLTVKIAGKDVSGDKITMGILHDRAEQELGYVFIPYKPQGGASSHSTTPYIDPSLGLSDELIELATEKSKGVMFSNMILESYLTDPTLRAPARDDFSSIPIEQGIRNAMIQSQLSNSSFFEREAKRLDGVEKSQESSRSLSQKFFRESDAARQRRLMKMQKELVVTYYQKELNKILAPGLTAASRYSLWCQLSTQWRCLAHSESTPDWLKLNGRTSQYILVLGEKKVKVTHTVRQVETILEKGLEQIEKISQREKNLSRPSQYASIGDNHPELARLRDKGAAYICSEHRAFWANRKMWASIGFTIASGVLLTTSVVGAPLGIAMIGAGLLMTLAFGVGRANAGAIDESRASEREAMHESVKQRGESFDTLSSRSSVSTEESHGDSTLEESSTGRHAPARERTTSDASLRSTNDRPTPSAPPEFDSTAIYSPEKRNGPSSGGLQVSIP